MLIHLTMINYKTQFSN